MNELWDQGMVGRLVPALEAERGERTLPHAADWTGEVGGAAGSDGAEIGGEDVGACACV